MKSKIVKLILAAVATLALPLALAACNQPETPEIPDGPVAPATYTVTYSVDENVTGSYNTASYQKDATFTLPDGAALSKADYVFAGWNDGTTNYPASTTYTMPAQNVTFTAVWRDATHVVTFNPNASKQYITTDIVDDGATVAEPTDPIKSDVTFMYWADATGEEYDFETLVYEDITLTAVYGYTVTYVESEGSDNKILADIVIETTAETLDLGVLDDKADTNPDDNVDDSILFGGWGSGYNLTYVLAEDGEAIWNVSGNIKVYPYWRPNVQVVFSTGNEQDVTGDAPATMLARLNSEITVPGAGTLQKTGYTLVGWQTASGYWKIPYNTGESYLVESTEPVEFTPVWEVEIVPNAVTFAAGEGATGTVPTSLNKTPSETFVLPAPGELAKSDCVFAGWNDGTTTYYAGQTYTMGSAAVTLTAQWIETTATDANVIVSYNLFTQDLTALGLAEKPTDENYKVGDTVTLPTCDVTSKPGANFAWEVRVSNGYGYVVMIEAVPFGGTFIMPAKNVRIQLAEIPVDVTIKAVYNSGEEPVILGVTQIGNYEGVELLDPTTVPEGKVFSTWAYNVEGTEEVYPFGSFTLNGMNSSKIAADNTLTLYAIYVDATPVVVPEVVENILEQANGKWSDGNNTVMIRAASNFDENKNSGYAGSAIINGKELLEIYYNKATKTYIAKDELINKYEIAFEDGILHFTAINGGFTAQLTKMNVVKDLDIASFIGMWKGTDAKNVVTYWNAKVTGVTYGVEKLTTIQNKNNETNILVVGEYLVIKGGDTVYYLVESENGLSGYAVKSGIATAINFVAEDFYTLTVDGKVAQHVGAEKTPNAAALKELSKKPPVDTKFVKWVVAGTTTEFDATAGMTANVAITMQTERILYNITASYQTADASKITYETAGADIIKVNKVTLNQQTLEMVIYYTLNEGAEQTATYSITEEDNKYTLPVTTIFGEGVAKYFAIVDEEATFYKEDEDTGLVDMLDYTKFNKIEKEAINNGPVGDYYAGGFTLYTVGNITVEGVTYDSATNAITFHYNDGASDLTASYTLVSDGFDDWMIEGTTVLANLNYISVTSDTVILFNYIGDGFTYTLDE